MLCADKDKSKSIKVMDKTILKYCKKKTTKQNKTKTKTLTVSENHLLDGGEQTYTT